LCLGRQLVVALSVLFALVVSAPSYASSILIYGNRAGNNNPLQQTLEGLGHSITNVSTDVLPVDLSVFDTIWHVSSNANGLGAAERAALATYVNNGGGLHLTGERPCCESMNTAVEQLANSLIVGPDISVGGQGDVSGIYTFNSGAVANIANAPNNLTNWNPNGPGGMADVASDNILATNNFGLIVGAAYDSDDLVGNAGRLTILMDVNWIESGSIAANVDAVENLQVFLESAPDVIAMPEPGTALLLASAGILAVRYRRRKRA